MKKLLLLFILPVYAFAQVNTGPTDITTPAPTASNAQSVGKIICAGQQITLNNDTINPTGWTFTWYKIATDGTRKTSTIVTSLYTETPITPGYYNYQLVVNNPVQGCTSPISDVFKVYVAPVLAVSITSPLSSTCSVTGTAITLTTVTTTGFTYSYQWLRNGVNIPGATASTYTVSGEKTAGSVTFSCNVSYNWGLIPNTTCTATGTKVITIINAPAKPIIQ